MELNYSYRKLNVYKYARALVLDTYKLIDKFPKAEIYALSDQLRRAIVSVPSNIAEGLGRSSDKTLIMGIDAERLEPPALDFV